MFLQCVQQKSLQVATPVNGDAGLGQMVADAVAEALILRSILCHPKGLSCFLVSGQDPGLRTADC